MLENVYYFLSAIITLLVLFGYYTALKNKGVQKSKISKNVSIAAAGLILWFLYLFVLSSKDILTSFSLPPKMPLLVVFPTILFLIFFVREQRRSDLLGFIPKTWPVFLQVFRIAVETLLYYTFLKEIIPETATFAGLNFDVAMGILAPFVAYFIFRKANLNKGLARFWNVLGIAMVLFVAFIIVTSTYFPNIWGSDVSLVSTEFFKLPYLLIPAFLAPLAIFMHVVSLIQINK